VSTWDQVLILNVAACDSFPWPLLRLEVTTPGSASPDDSPGGGHYGEVRLDGLKFWFAGDKGDAKIVELTFEPSATKEQRQGIREFLSHFLPLEWESFTEGPDAKIEWKAEAVRAEASGVDSIFRRHR
jgi:hypothetical protein